MEGRRIAYILYLVPKDWSQEDGGTLDLYSVDENGYPQEVETSIVPVWNSLLFFEVTPLSFHRVSEFENFDSLTQTQTTIYFNSEKRESDEQ